MENDEKMKKLEELIKQSKDRESIEGGGKAISAYIREGDFVEALKLAIRIGDANKAMEVYDQGLKSYGKVAFSEDVLTPYSTKADCKSKYKELATIMEDIDRVIEVYESSSYESRRFDALAELCMDKGISTKDIKYFIRARDYLKEKFRRDLTSDYDPLHGIYLFELRKFVDKIIEHYENTGQINLDIKA